MARIKRLASSLLLGAGTLLVFSGFSAALGFTVTGVVASVAAVAGLLYAGGVLFGERPSSGTVLIFDETLTLTCGTPLLSVFPRGTHDAVRACAIGALAGQRGTFMVGQRSYHVAPVALGTALGRYGAVLEDVPSSAFAHPVQAQQYPSAASV